MCACMRACACVRVRVCVCIWCQPVPSCSSLSWNTYHAADIIAADYDGVLSMYDASTGQRVRSFQVSLLAISVTSACTSSQLQSPPLPSPPLPFLPLHTPSHMPFCVVQEHEKRAWSVHFSPTNPNLFVSASDDCRGERLATSVSVAPAAPNSSPQHQNQCTSECCVLWCVASPASPSSSLSPTQ